MSVPTLHITVTEMLYAITPLVDLSALAIMALQEMAYAVPVRM